MIIISTHHKRLIFSRGNLPHQRGASIIAFIAIVLLFTSAVFIVITNNTDSSDTEHPSQAESSTSGTGNNVTENFADVTAEYKETQNRDNNDSQILTTQRHDMAPERNIEVPTDNSTYEQTYNYSEIPNSPTAVRNESSDDTVRYNDKNSSDIEQRWKSILAATTSRMEPSLTTPETVTPESTQTEPVRPEFTETLPPENTDSQTSEYVPGLKVYCGKTEAELYEWYKVAPDATFDFMWNCIDV